MCSTLGEIYACYVQDMPVTKDKDFYPTKSKHELYYPSPPIVQLILIKDLHSRCYGRCYTFAFLKGSAVPYIVLLPTLDVLAQVPQGSNYITPSIVQI